MITSWLGFYFFFLKSHTKFIQLVSVQQVVWNEVVGSFQFCSNTYVIQLASMLVTPDWTFQPKSSKHQTRPRGLLCQVIVAVRKSSTKQGLFSECNICIYQTGFSLPGDIKRWLGKGHLIIYWLAMVCRNPWCKGSKSSNLTHLPQLMLPAGAALGYLHLNTNVLGLPCWGGALKQNDYTTCLSHLAMQSLSFMVRSALLLSNPPFPHREHRKGFHTVFPLNTKAQK